MAKFSEKESTALAVVLPLGKTCPHCQVSKSLDQFYKSKCSPDGVDSWCKECQVARRRDRYRSEQDERYGVTEAERRRQQLEAKRGAAPGHKVCHVCGLEKPLEQFYTNGKKTLDGLSSYCKSCTAAYSQQLRAKSPRHRLSLSFNTARISARRKKITFSLTVDYLLKLWKKQNGQCFYSGVQMLYTGGGALESVSIDRVDSGKGYTADNVVLCCTYVNRMKNAVSAGKFIWWCDRIARHSCEVRHR
jgi:hypothetical protein